MVLEKDKEEERNKDEEALNNDASHMETDILGSSMKTSFIVVTSQSVNLDWGPHTLLT